MEPTFVDTIGQDLPKTLFSKKQKDRKRKKIFSTNDPVRKTMTTEDRIHELKKELGMIP